MAQRRYKTPALQAMYDNCQRLAADRSSSFWFKGQPHRGAGQRSAYWNGRSEVPRALTMVGDGKTLADAAYRAGQDDAKKPSAERFVTEFVAGQPYTRPASYSEGSA